MSGSDRPAVSALVVNYNSGDWLRLCLESLQAIAEAWRRDAPAKPGSLAGLEAVVVDNASSDGSLTTVREFEAAGAPGLPVQLVEAGRNLGFGAACNLAAAKSAGRHLLLLNPDAWIDEESLRRLVEAQESEDRLAVAAPCLSYPDGSPQFVWAPPVGVLGEAIQRFRNRFEKVGWNHDLLPGLLRPCVGAGWYTAACLLVRRAAFDDIGGFDERFFLYFEDADLCLRLRRAGFRLREVPGARAWHVRGAVTGTDRERRLTPAAERFYRASQLRYYGLHRPRWERAYLRRRLRRKFRRVEDEEQRRALLRLLEGGDGC
ncbi:MAG: glycosyltransferase family 2 protein [Acidobacteria bacterium]|nr:glycosyltransferase family 2 protein [Acidobacteriota bacterium]